jgi:trehalose 6-phosphate synthase
VQVAVPSRGQVPAYQRLRKEVERLVGQINGEFGTPSWTPIHYIHRPVSAATLLSLYRAADVMLVTPLRDGMNLVAHEYVAAQDADDPGVLVLSRFAGASSYFQDALIVNPNDPDEIAEAMHTALNMPLQERRRRHMRLFENVLRLTAASYCQTFLDALSGKQPGNEK